MMNQEEHGVIVRLELRDEETEQRPAGEIEGPHRLFTENPLGLRLAPLLRQVA